MSSDYGDMCRELREEKRELRAKFGVECPECIRLLPRANPSILLPGQARERLKMRNLLCRCKDMLSNASVPRDLHFEFANLENDIAEAMKAKP